MWHYQLIPLPETTGWFLVGYVTVTLCTLRMGILPLLGGKAAHATMSPWSFLPWMLVAFSWPGFIGLIWCLAFGTDGLIQLVVLPAALVGWVIAICAMTQIGAALSMAPPWPKNWFLTDNFRGRRSRLMWVGFALTLTLNVYALNDYMRDIPRTTEWGNTDRSIRAQAESCSDFSSCVKVMLLAIDPPQSEFVHRAAVSLQATRTPTQGNRQEARKLNAMGLKEFRNKNYSAAVEHFQRAAQTDPGDAEVQSNLAHAAARIGQLNKANDAIAKSVTINPYRVSAWVTYAELLLQRNSLDEAQRALLIGYEFSKNKTGTVKSFTDRSRSAETEAERALYSATLRRLPSPPEQIKEEKQPRRPPKIPQ